MAHADSLQLFCPAKVNLALSVGAPNDSGYHPIASWMVAVNFADTLTLKHKDGGASTFAIHFGDDAPLRRDVDWPIEKDLAFRAHGLLQQHVGRTLPVEVGLDKSIPAGAGLGGGSSDAAGMLVGLNRLFELDVTRDELTRLGARLGCDVAFGIAALSGQPAAIATGYGEKLEPAPLDEPIHLVLILPPFACPTASVYAAFDRTSRAEVAVHEARVRRLADASPVPQDGPFNDLTDAAACAQPRLGEALTKLRDATGVPVHVTGSGSAMFIIAPSAETAKVLVCKVTAIGFAALSTHTLPYRSD